MAADTNSVAKEPFHPQSLVTKMLHVKLQIIKCSTRNNSQEVGHLNSTATMLLPFELLVGGSGNVNRNLFGAKGNGENASTSWVILLVLL